MPRARSICYTETRIDAAPAAVMAALRDVGAYAAWGCPFTERIDVDAASSSLAPGTLLTEHVRLSPGDAATRGGERHRSVRVSLKARGPR